MSIIPDESNNRSPAAEAEYLTRTLTFAEQELARAKTSGDDIKSAIIAAKRELRESTTHAIGNLWNGENFEALSALNQYANPINDQLIEFEENENKIARLENILKSPYFARIDFEYGDSDERQSSQGNTGSKSFKENTVDVYIGRSSLKDNKTHHMYIYDWRSPIASVFYRFTSGVAYYDAPGGRMEGILTFKRQYEIRNGVMEYYFDADVQIVDEFLRKLLSQNTSSHMKTIVETIQKEQDIVIRDMENDLMMVQGVAGSGKTSIALHRAAYLMYQGLTGRLKAHDILIISPNSLFEQYISRVLPDLGEENIASALFEEIAGKVLGYKKVQVRAQYLEKLLSGDGRRGFLSGETTPPFGHPSREGNYGTVPLSLLEYKTSLTFADIIDRFIDIIPDRFLEISNIDYNGQSIMSAKQIRHKLTSAVSNTPLGLKLQQIESHIMETVKSLHRVYRNHDELVRIKKRIQGFTTLDIKQLYRLLFTDEYILSNLMANVPPDIINLTAENLQNKTIAYDDLAALFYLKLKLYGADEYKHIRHVVIDEAQDYYPLHYKIFKLLFPKTKYTVLGDFNQTLEKDEDISLYDRISEILEKPKSILVTMDKSFRSTNEIIAFSSRFLSHDIEIKSFNRSGEEPKIYSASTETELAKIVAEESQRLIDSGYQSVGLICKTAANAKMLFHDITALKLDCCTQASLGLLLARNDANTRSIKLITTGTEEELTGLFIIPVYLAKGLEFDAVLICDASRENYSTDEDKKLLYIASTRALHHLGVYGVEENPYTSFKD